MKESLVDVSPSTVMQLKERCAACATAARSKGSETRASQATNPSMVAMLGWIMPAPLARPVTFTVAAPISIRREAALGRVSVVMIACAAASQLSARIFDRQTGKPAASFPIGSGSMMTPVENGSTCDGEQPSSCASSLQVRRAAATPSRPVPAFAQPVFTTRARIDPSRSLADRCSRATVTGAAQKRFDVNTPATRAPSSSLMTRRSLRPALRMFASATPSATPATGRRLLGSGCLRLTAMGLPAVSAVVSPSRPIIAGRKWLTAPAPSAETRNPALQASRRTLILYSFQEGSLSREPSMAVLVLLPGAARTRVVATDLLAAAHVGLRALHHRNVALGFGLGLGGLRDAGAEFGVLILHVARGLGLFHLRELFRSAELHGHQNLRHLVLYQAEQHREQLERLALVFLGRVLLGVTAQMYALPQGVERRQVLTPVRIEALQHDRPLDAVYLRPVELCDLGLILIACRLDD